VIGVQTLQLEIPELQRRVEAMAPGAGPAPGAAPGAGPGPAATAAEKARKLAEKKAANEAAKVGLYKLSSVYPYLNAPSFNPCACAVK
jgi:hypothetical protein